MYWGFVTLCSFALIYLSSCSTVSAKDGIGFDILEFDDGKETPFKEAFRLRGQFVHIDCRASRSNVDELPYSVTPLKGAAIQVICHHLNTSVHASTNDLGIFEVEIPNNHASDIFLKINCFVHLVSSMVMKSNSKEVYIPRGPLGGHVFTRVKNFKTKEFLYKMPRSYHVSTSCRRAPRYEHRQLEQVDYPYYTENSNSSFDANKKVPISRFPSAKAPPPAPQPANPYLQPTAPNFPPYKIDPSSSPPLDGPSTCIPECPDMDAIYKDNIYCLCGREYSPDGK